MSDKKATTTKKAKKASLKDLAPVRDPKGGEMKTSLRGDTLPRGGWEQGTPPAGARPKTALANTNHGTWLTYLPEPAPASGSGSCGCVPWDWSPRRWLSRRSTVIRMKPAARTRPVPYAA